MKTCRNCYRYNKSKDKKHACSKARVERVNGKSFVIMDMVDTKPGKKACDEYKSSRSMDLNRMLRRAQNPIKRMFQVHIRFPLGKLRKPVPLEWVDGYDYRNDSIEPNSEPRCPHCGEMPYSTKRCVFCGQRFTLEEEV